MTSFKMVKMNGAARTQRDVDLDRKAVCRRCGHVMRDVEEFAGYGEFWHDRRVCSNSGKVFSLAPEHSKEVVPFESKRVRRAAKRIGARV
jgi:hypothetical protein